MKTSTTRLIVAVITKDRLYDLRECLDSLMNQLERGDKCIVVDSSLNKDTHDYIVRYNYHSVIKILYIHEPRRGFPIARNRALRASHSSWIAFTDDDCIVDNRWVDALKLALIKRPEAAALSGLSLTAYPKNGIALSCEINENYWKTKGRIGNRITDFETLDNKNVAYNTNFLKKHQITYDESRAKRFAGASDDCDFGMQIQAAGGMAFYTPEAIVFHKDPKTLAAITPIKIHRTLAHTTYEEKWESYRKSLPSQKLNKITFVMNFVQQKRLSNRLTVQVLFCLIYTFFLIRYTKTLYWLMKRST
jgi:GT2 family glycosyltransferase